jgi:hypothetical protein
MMVTGSQVRHDDTGVTGTVTTAPDRSGYIEWVGDDGETYTDHVFDMTTLNPLAAITASFYEIHNR